VGVAAVRYNIARVQPEKPMTFKWEDALNFEGNSAPFIQYAHTRARGILSKAGASPSRPKVPDILEPGEARLLKSLAKLPSVVSKCAGEMTPHIFASFAFTLASEFNQFYRDCPVIGAEQGIREFRLSLAQGAEWALSSSLGILGLPVPPEM
jgi:arginyl-tRNA synthetase